MSPVVEDMCVHQSEYVDTQVYFYIFLCRLQKVPSIFEMPRKEIQNWLCFGFLTKIQKCHIFHRASWRERVPFCGGACRCLLEKTRSHVRCIFATEAAHFFMDFTITSDGNEEAPTTTLFM